MIDSKCLQCIRRSPSKLIRIPRGAPVVLFFCPSPARATASASRPHGNEQPIDTSSVSVLDLAQHENVHASATRLTLVS